MSQVSGPRRSRENVGLPAGLAVINKAHQPFGGIERKMLQIFHDEEITLLGLLHPRAGHGRRFLRRQVSLFHAKRCAGWRVAERRYRLAKVTRGYQLDSVESASGDFLGQSGNKMAFASSRRPVQE